MNAFKQALYARLAGSLPLTNLLASPTSIYDTEAPENAALPFVVFHLQSALTENIDPNRREDMFYTVQGITEAGFKAAGDIDAQIDNLLHDWPLVVAGYGTLFQRRVQSIEYLELSTYYHAGGVYRFWLSKS